MAQLFYIACAYFPVRNGSSFCVDGLFTVSYDSGVNGALLKFFTNAINLPR